MTDRTHRESIDLPSPASRDGTPASPGKRSLTQGLMPRPVVFRVESADAARELGTAFGRRDANGVSADAEAAVDRATAGVGEPLRADVRDRFEASLGADLSAVRVHRSAVSAEASAAVGARAYTVGNDIHFGADEYRPDDPFGLHLLAHEVAHTVQQQGGAARRQHKLAVSMPLDDAERDADRAADAMVAGAPAAIEVGATMIYRKPTANKPAGNGKVSIATADRTFRAWWNGKPEGIAAAEAKTRTQLGAGLPDGWQPPPLRERPAAAPSTPGINDNYHPDETNSTQVPASSPTDEGCTESTEHGDQAYCAPPDPEPTAVAAPTDGDPAPSQGDKPGKSAFKLGISPKSSPFGGAIQFDNTGGVEGSFKIKLAKLPSYKVVCEPAPVFFQLKPELSASARLKRDGEGNWNVLEGTVDLSGAATGELGIPDVASAGVGLKLTGSFSLGGLHWDAKTAEWSFKPVTITLKCAPIITATIGPVSHAFEMASYELLIVTLSSHEPYITARKGPGVDEMVKDVRRALLPDLAKQRPLTPEEEAELERLDSHSDTEDGAMGSHG